MTVAREVSGPVPVSIIICSRERREMLRDTITSVLEGRSLPRELVIVDQSRDADPVLESLELKTGEVIYLHSNSVGLSRARNIGLRAAGQPVAVMVDDDMLAEPEWLGELIAGLPDRPSAIATGQVLAAAAEGPGSGMPPAALVERPDPAVFVGVQPFDPIPGANVALPCELVLELGGYDERLGAGTRFAAADDNDLGHRLLAAGCTVHHVPSAVMFHRAWRTRRELIGLRWGYGRGKGAFYAKHLSLRDPLMRGRISAEVERRLARAFRSLRRPKGAAMELLSLAALASGGLEWLALVRLPAAVRSTFRS